MCGKSGARSYVLEHQNFDRPTVERLNRLYPRVQFCAASLRRQYRWRWRRSAFGLPPHDAERWHGATGGAAQCAERIQAVSRERGSRSESGGQHLASQAGCLARRWKPAPVWRPAEHFASVGRSRQFATPDNSALLSHGRIDDSGSRSSRCDSARRSRKTECRPGQCESTWRSRPTKYRPGEHQSSVPG